MPLKRCGQFATTGVPGSRRRQSMRRIVGSAPPSSPTRRYAASWIWPLGSGVLMKPLKKIPTFKDEDAEREFWATADSTAYIDWSKAQRINVPKFRRTLKKPERRKQRG